MRPDLRIMKKSMGVKRNFMSVENYSIPLWVLTLVLFIIFQVLLSTCKLD